MHSIAGRRRRSSRIALYPLYFLPEWVHATICEKVSSAGQHVCRLLFFYHSFANARFLEGRGGMHFHIFGLGIGVGLELLVPIAFACCLMCMWPWL